MCACHADAFAMMLLALLIRHCRHACHLLPPLRLFCFRHYFHFRYAIFIELSFDFRFADIAATSSFTISSDYDFLRFLFHIFSTIYIT
jgi:hypothetical protein